MTTPVLVCRSGGDFLPEHANTLASALLDVGKLSMPIILTDFDPVAFRYPTRRLQRHFPGWWSKMELFAPWNRDLGDIFYVDLDTVIVGALNDLLMESKLIMLRDFNAADDTLQSGLMLLPAAVRRRVWTLWDLEPERFMKWFVRYGDGSLLNILLGAGAQTWQDLFPGRVVSYKRDVVRNSFYEGSSDVIPAGASVVCYHGRPRPWAKNRPTTQELVERTSSSFYLKGREP